MVPPIYCINVVTSTARKERMTERFTRLNILDQVTFIEAITRENPIIYKYRPDFKNVPTTDLEGYGTVACLASHLLALRMIVDAGHPGAIVCEDDILLHNNFHQLWASLESKRPANARIIVLGYIPIEKISYEKALTGPLDQERLECQQDQQVSLDLYHPTTKDEVLTWGGILYWVSREYALEALEEYDVYDSGSDRNLRTSEMITNDPSVLLAVPMLAIEECRPSDLRPPHLSRESDHAKHFMIIPYLRFGLGSQVGTYHDYVPQPVEYLNRFMVDVSLWRLKMYREQSQNAVGSIVGRYVYSLWMKGKVTFPPTELVQFLDEVYIMSFYSNKPFALEVAEQMQFLIRSVSGVKTAYYRNRDHLKDNFSHIGVELP